LVNQKIIQSETRKTIGKYLIPPVVIPGSRGVDSEFGKKYNLSVAAPMIVKYRDAKTDSKTALEQA